LDKNPSQTQKQFKVAAKSSRRVSGILRSSMAIGVVGLNVGPLNADLLAFLKA
jgi:hypothetical protein